MNDENNLDNVSYPACYPRMEAQQIKEKKRYRIMKTVCMIMILIGVTIIFLMVMLTHIANEQRRKRKLEGKDKPDQPIDHGNKQD